MLFWRAGVFKKLVMDSYKAEAFLFETKSIYKRLAYIWVMSETGDAAYGDFLSEEEEDELEEELYDDWF